MVGFEAHMLSIFSINISFQVEKPAFINFLINFLKNFIICMLRQSSHENKFKKSPNSLFFNGTDFERPQTAKEFPYNLNK